MGGGEFAGGRDRREGGREDLKKTKKEWNYNDWWGRERKRGKHRASKPVCK